MSGYSKKELELATPFTAMFFADIGFRKWLLYGTRHEISYNEAHCIEEEQMRVRGKTKCPFWFNHYHGSAGNGIETDAVLLLERNDGRRLSCHIEFKRDGDCLGEMQAENYPLRADLWATQGHRPLPKHDDWLTFLVCGDNLLTDERIQCFDKVIFHSELENRVLGYPKVIS